MLTESVAYIGATMVSLLSEDAESFLVNCDGDGAVAMGICAFSTSA